MSSYPQRKEFKVLLMAGGNIAKHWVFITDVDEVVDYALKIVRRPS